MMRLKSVFLAGAALLAGTSIAHADMGKAPGSAPGTYFSGEGGYLYQDGGEVNGHGISSSPGTFGERFVSPEDGWFAGGLIGFSNGVPFFAGTPFTRLEAYLSYGITEETETDSAPPLDDISLKSVDGAINIIGGLRGRTSVERESTEGGVRLEGDQALSSTSSVTWVLGSFVRLTEEDTETTVEECCVLHRNGDVDTWMYGVLAAAEPEFWLTPGVALVGRVGVGIYGYDADGDFRSFSTGLAPPDPFLASASDSASGVGFRGLLGAGLKFKLGSDANLETFAEADYFSDVGTARFSNSDASDNTASRVETDDLWEVRTGLRLTIGLGGGN